MRNKKVYEITVISIFTAMIVVMALVPMLGYIQIGAVAITIIHIPVLIGGIFGGRKVAYSLGLVFGLTSLFVALTRASTPVDLLFVNPLISVLPRFLFGIALYEIYVGLSKVIKNGYISIPISMVLSTLVHTLLVLTMLYLVGEATLREVGVTDNLLPFIWGVLISNGIIEAVLAGLVGGPIAQRLLATKNKDLM